MLALIVAVAVTVSPVPAESRQLVLAVTPAWDDSQGTVALYERLSPNAPWRRKADLGSASFGRAGLAWGRGLHAAGQEGPIKKEGDGRAPAGVFRLSGASGYAPAPPPGAPLPYRQSTATLRCVDDPASRHYNTWVEEGRVEKDWTSAEDMRRTDDLYRWTVWVGHNDDPPQAGAGSCIFLHLRASPSSTTAGCTAFDPGDMDRLMAWLDPKAHPVLVQLPAPVLERLRKDWGLPAP
jgi:L,D-peptidoglycan transpeptidase YkuD (ErfK/YbiS/YcfS/YnhG family)